MIKDVHKLYNLPSKRDLKKLIEQTIMVLQSENDARRPKDETGLAGAYLDIACFSPDLPVVLVPDLHARLDFFLEILDFPLCLNEKTGETLPILQALEEKKVVVLCVGDGLHSELRGRERWLLAEEFWVEHEVVNKYLCEEMQEGFGLMTKIMQTKCCYPDHFHFLRGNHENILNQFVCGSMPFRKFASEGEMVKDFMLAVYGEKITRSYADFEYNLPLFGKGKNFLVSHAEPACAYGREELIDGFLDENVIRGLIWTANEEAEEDAVATMLAELLPDEKNALYFAGHRAINGTYSLQRNDKFIQIHNPNEHYISIVWPNRVFNPKLDIYDTKTCKSV